MDGVFNWQLILDEHFELIPLINFNQRARLLAINKIDLPSKTVYIMISKCDARYLLNDFPGALNPLWIVKSYVRSAAFDGPVHTRRAMKARRIRGVNILEMY